MTTTPPAPRRPSPAEQLTAVERDEILVDALASGQPAPAGEPVADLLSAWRTEVTAAAQRALDHGTPLPARPVPIRTSPGLPRRPILIAAAAVALSGGFGLVTLNAPPASPLWPVTQTVFPRRAALRLARQAIDDAREAAAQGRYADARRHLEQAETLIQRLGDDPLSDELRAEVDMVRRTLPEAGSPRPATPSPTDRPPMTSPASPSRTNHQPPAIDPPTSGPAGPDTGTAAPPHEQSTHHSNDRRDPPAEPRVLPSKTSPGRGQSVKEGARP